MLVNYFTFRQIDSKIKAKRKNPDRKVKKLYDLDDNYGMEGIFGFFSLDDLKQNFI